MQNLRKLLVLAVFLVLAMAMSVAAYANSDIRVTIDNEFVVFDGQIPVNVGGRTLVPVRGVFEMLGFSVSWENSTSTATLTRHDYTIIITVGSDEFTTNGTVHRLDVPAQIINGSTMLPIRAVLESVGYSLGWDEHANIAFITTTGFPFSSITLENLQGEWINQRQSPDFGFVEHRLVFDGSRTSHLQYVNGNRAVIFEGLQFTIDGNLLTLENPRFNPPMVLRIDSPNTPNARLMHYPQFFEERANLPQFWVSHSPTDIVSNPTIFHRTSNAPTITAPPAQEPTQPPTTTTPGQPGQPGSDATTQTPNIMQVYPNTNIPTFGAFVGIPRHSIVGQDFQYVLPNHITESDFRRYLIHLTLNHGFSLDSVALGGNTLANFSLSSPMRGNDIMLGFVRSGNNATITQLLANFHSAFTEDNEDAVFIGFNTIVIP